MSNTQKSVDIHSFVLSFLSSIKKKKIIILLCISPKQSSADNPKAVREDQWGHNSEGGKFSSLFERAVIPRKQHMFDVFNLSLSVSLFLLPLGPKCGYSPEWAQQNRVISSPDYWSEDQIGDPKYLESIEEITVREELRKGIL